MKRLIFSLLYDEGYFVLSRNFNRQKVGDINWLLKNYNFETISTGIDELIIIDVSNKINKEKFIDDVKQINKKIFIPITLGGSIKSLKDVDYYLNNGADKILLNNIFFEDKKLPQDIASRFGKQFIVGCIDYKLINSEFKIYKNRAEKLCENLNLNDHIQMLVANGAGEIILQSIDQDGTGMGIDLEILKEIDKLKVMCPIILKGGIGKPEHIKSILLNENVNAICTANLFNFIGNTFTKTRELLYKENIKLAKWETKEIYNLKNIFKK